MPHLERSAVLTRLQPATCSKRRAAVALRAGCTQDQWLASNDQQSSPVRWGRTIPKEGIAPRPTMVCVASARRLPPAHTAGRRLHRRCGSRRLAADHGGAARGGAPSQDPDRGVSWGRLLPPLSTQGADCGRGAQASGGGQIQPGGAAEAQSCRATAASEKHRGHGPQAPRGTQRTATIVVVCGSAARRSI